MLLLKGMIAWEGEELGKGSQKLRPALSLSSREIPSLLFRNLSLLPPRGVVLKRGMDLSWTSQVLHRWPVFRSGMHT